MKEIVNRLAANKDAAVAVLAKMADVRTKQLEAFILVAAGQREEALRVLQAAAEIEDAPGVNLAPPDSGSALPSREMLGELLIEMQRPQEAIREFEAALRRAPGRLRSLDGLARAAVLSGDRAAAEARYQALLKLLSDADPDLPQINQARQYLRR